MSTADESLRALLAADAAVAALVGERIAADRVEQGTALPFVVFTGSAEPQRGLDGSVHGVKTTFEIQCWATTRAQANAVAQACKAALDAQHQYAAGPVNGYDQELDLEAALISCEWWED